MLQVTKTDNSKYTTEDVKNELKTLANKTAKQFNNIMYDWKFQYALNHPKEEHIDYWEFFVDAIENSEED